MRNGLVLIRVGSVPPKKIIAEIRGLEGVTDAYGVFGRFDIVAFLESDDYYHLKDIAGKISMIEGIKSTETLLHGD